MVLVLCKTLVARSSINKQISNQEVRMKSKLGGIDCGLLEATALTLQ